MHSVYKTSCWWQGAHKLDLVGVEGWHQLLRKLRDGIFDSSLDEPNAHGLIHLCVCVLEVQGDGLSLRLMNST